MVLKKGGTTHFCVDFRKVSRGGGQSAGRGPAESGCPTSDEESNYGPSELEGETPGAWDLPLDYFFLFRTIFVLRPCL
ncbi:UNVERIFIED_CONTAM: hypothetical protein FKN15_054123 [Acipenser sinensis]